MSKADKFMSDQCRHFDSCSASLCPFDSEHLKVGLWYPEEEICRLKKIPDWIKQQKKIAKKTKEKDTIITMKY